MTANQLKKNRRARRKLQIRIMKAALLLLAIVLPLLLLPSKSKTKRYEPMEAATVFVDYLIHAQAVEACTVATPQSADDIYFYTTWVHDAVADNPDNVRFLATHVLKPEDGDTEGYVKGVLSVKNNDGKWCEIHSLVFKLVYTSQRGWIVDYDMNNVEWCH